MITTNGAQAIEAVVFRYGPQACFGYAKARQDDGTGMGIYFHRNREFVVEIIDGTPVLTDRRPESAQVLSQGGDGVHSTRLLMRVAGPQGAQYATAWGIIPSSDEDGPAPIDWPSELKSLGLERYVGGELHRDEHYKGEILAIGFDAETLELTIRFRPAGQSGERERTYSLRHDAVPVQTMPGWYSIRIPKANPDTKRSDKVLTLIPPD
jgi:hypothetical protein